MKAVIMAGGKGTRLASVLRDIPKPMVGLAGKPLLEYQVKNLRENGVTDIILVIGHLGNVIRDYFGDGSRFGVSITYHEEKKPLGTAGALYYLKETLDDDFILLFGDLFVNINFMRFYEFHKKKNALITLYTHPNSHPYDSDIIMTDANAMVTGWSYKNSVRERDYKNQVNAGIYVISPKVLEIIPENQKIDLEKQVITGLIPQRGIYAYSCTEYVKDIGTPERLSKVELDLKNKICEKRNLGNRQKCIFLDRDGTINRYVGFLRRPEQMELEDYVAEAICKANESEYLVIVVSNQPVIARGECTYDCLEEIHNHMHVLLGEKGAYVDDLYFCPHHPDMGFAGEVKELKMKCTCRKPEVGMLVKAAEEHNIDLKNSWMVGDMSIDVQTGINAGMKTVLLRTGMAGNDGKYNVQADYCAENILDAINFILETKGTQ